MVTVEQLVEYTRYLVSVGDELVTRHYPPLVGRMDVWVRAKGAVEGWSPGRVVDGGIGYAVWESRLVEAGQCWWGGAGGRPIKVSQELAVWDRGEVGIEVVLVWQKAEQEVVKGLKCEAVRAYVERWLNEVWLRQKVWIEDGMWVIEGGPWGGLKMVAWWRGEKRAWLAATGVKSVRMVDGDEEGLLAKWQALVVGSKLEFFAMNWLGAEEWILSEQKMMVDGGGGGGEGEAVQIGGLRPEIKEQLERICQLWSLSGRVRERIGLRLPRGILLWGPPGTGKTLLARYISRMISGSVLKLVRGPEVLSKWMGESELGVRGWFKGATDDWVSKGWESPLHIVVIDEIDSLMRTREGQIGDGIVTQFLAMIDGIDTPPNLMVIGTTNHLERVDPAIRRPGRLELSFEMGYVERREDWVEICAIHLRRLWGAEAERIANQWWERADGRTQWTGAAIEHAVQARLLRLVDHHKFKLPEGEEATLDLLRRTWELLPF